MEYESIASRRERRATKASGMYNETQMWAHASERNQFDPVRRRRRASKPEQIITFDDDRRRNEPRGNKKKINYTGTLIVGDSSDSETKYVNFAKFKGISTRKPSHKKQVEYYYESEDSTLEPDQKEI